MNGSASVRVGDAIRRIDDAASDILLFSEGRQLVLRPTRFELHRLLTWLNERERKTFAAQRMPPPVMQMNTKPFDPGRPFKPEGAMVSLLVLMAEHLWAERQNLSAQDPKDSQQDTAQAGELAQISRRGLHNLLQGKLGAWSECERISVAVAALQTRIDKLGDTDPRKGTDFSKLLLKASWISLGRARAQQREKRQRMPQAVPVELTELAKNMITRGDIDRDIGFAVWMARPDPHGSWLLEEIEADLGDGLTRSTAIISEIFKHDISRCRLYWRRPLRSTVVVPRKWLLDAVSGRDDAGIYNQIMERALNRLDAERKLADPLDRTRIIIFLRLVNRRNRNPLTSNQKVCTDLDSVIKFREALSAFRKTRPSRKKWAEFWKGNPSRKAVDPQDKWKIGW